LHVSGRSQTVLAELPHALPALAFDHEVVLELGRQTWQGLAGFEAPDWYKVPWMRQPALQTLPQPQTMPGQQLRSLAGELTPHAFPVARQAADAGALARIQRRPSATASHSTLPRPA